MRRADLLAILALCLVTVGIVGWRTVLSRSDDEEVLPRPHHRLRLQMNLVGVGQDISVTAALPSTEARQQVANELVSSGSSLTRSPGREAPPAGRSGPAAPWTASTPSCTSPPFARRAGASRSCPG